MEHPESRRGMIVGILTYIAWGLLTIYWKQLHHFDAFELIGWRVTTSALIMAMLLSVRRRWAVVLGALRTRTTAGRIVLAAVMLTANWTTYVWSVVHGHVLETALGYFMAPLLGMLVGVVVLHERLRPAQWIAAVLAAAALVILTISYGRVPVAAVIIAVSWTWYSYLKGRIALTPVESMAAESLVLVVPAAALLVLRAQRAESVLHTANATHLLLVLLSGAITVAPLMSFAYAAQRLPLSMLAPLQYTVPTINFLLGWLAYDESVSSTRLIGFALVWLGLALITLDSLRRARRPDAIVPAPKGGHE